MDGEAIMGLSDENLNSSSDDFHLV
jgi:hypothetical protein